MRTCPSEALTLQMTDQPVPTIEIDRGSIPEGLFLQSVLCEALATLGTDAQPSTLHTHLCSSYNFHEPTESVFIMVVGGEGVLRHLYDYLSKIIGLRIRYSDHLAPKKGMPIAHLESGTIWRPLDAVSWRANDRANSDDANSADNEDVVEDDEYLGDLEHEDGDDEDSDWDIFEDPTAKPEEEAIASRQAKAPLRLRAARADASVGSIARTIERMLSLPKGSVLLCGPDRRALRRDASIATLRRRWE